MLEMPADWLDKVQNLQSDVIRRHRAILDDMLKEGAEKGLPPSALMFFTGILLGGSLGTCAILSTIQDPSGHLITPDDILFMSLASVHFHASMDKRQAFTVNGCFQKASVDYQKVRGEAYVIKGEPIDHWIKLSEEALEKTKDKQKLPEWARRPWKDTPIVKPADEDEDETAKRWRKTS